MTIIEINNLHKVFDDGITKPLFNGLSLKVKRGEVVCLFGPSGCGKTTLLKIISRLIEPTVGKVRFFGKAGQITKMPTLGYIFQEPRLLPWKTVEENIGVVIGVDGRNQDLEIKERINEILHQVQLQDYRKKYPFQLSGGEKQRVGIARAFIINPNILLMDEPFSKLDELTATKLRVDIAKILERYKSTAVLATHNPLEAIYLADRILVFSGEKPTAIKCIVTVNIPRPRNKKLYEELIFDTRVSLLMKKLISYVD